MGSTYSGDTRRIRPAAAASSGQPSSEVREQVGGARVRATANGFPLGADEEENEEGDGNLGVFY